MLIIAAYDIADNRRRTRIVRVLEGYGHRVQESIFECHLDQAAYKRMQQEAEKHINPEEDRMRYYALCAKDAADIQVAGCAAVTSDPALYLI